MVRALSRTLRRSSLHPANGDGVKWTVSPDDWYQSEYADENAEQIETHDVGDNHTLRVGFVLWPEFTFLPFAGFVDALRHASDFGDRSNQVRCTWTVMAPTPDPIRSSCGVEVIPWGPLRDPREFDYIVVVGGRLPAIETADPVLVEYLQLAARNSIALVGVCTGSFVLARAGLMNRRRCCIHSYHYRDFIEAFPTLTPVTDEIFVIDRNRITCAGGASVIDLAAYLVELHCGKDRALKIIHHLVVDEARPPSHAQRPLAFDYARVNDHRVRRAVFLMEQHMSEPLQISAIAGRLNTGVRQLERAFQRTLEMAPGMFYRNMRLRYGRWLLVNSAHSITRVALECGFSDGAHFTRCFRREFRCLPSKFKKSGRAGLTNHGMVEVHLPSA